MKRAVLGKKGTAHVVTGKGLVAERRTADDERCRPAAGKDRQRNPSQGPAFQEEDKSPIAALKGAINRLF